MRRTIGIGEMDVRGHASFFILAVTWSSLKIGIADDLVVKTNIGKLRGFSETVHGTNILQFVGVPYAKAAVGSLRFRKPEPLDPWNGIKDVTKYGPSCIQGFFLFDFRSRLPNSEVSEDCLTLQIYIPETVKPDSPKSVMIWIHGGCFLVGQGMSYDGRMLAATGDVIVVTINYRLGLFGFLSTGDEASPGNYSLWDQRLAIVWVKENIAQFGGDPKSITLFGNSAGGVSTGMQSITPLNHNSGLFQRGIMQSGTMFAKWALTRDPLSVTAKIAEEAGCLENVQDINTTLIIDCLRKTDAGFLDSVATKIQFPLHSNLDEYVYLFSVGPVVDGTFLPDTPENLLSNRKSPSFELYTSIDIMSGVTDGESVLSFLNLNSYQKPLNFDISKGIPVGILCEQFAHVFARQYFNGYPGVADAICQTYKNVDVSLEEQSYLLLETWADFFFNVPHVAALNARSGAKASTYAYQFTYQPPYALIPSPDWYKRSEHCAEIEFLFNFKMAYPVNATISEADNDMAEKMMIWWSNFAKTGNPNNPGNSDWKSYQKENQVYMKINSSPHLETALYEERVKFWLEYLPRVTANSREDL